MKNNESIKERENVSFRLRKDVVKKMKEEAAKDQRNPNNYLETLLMNLYKIK